MSAAIAAVFANNGSGVRGDLRAVVRAILLDAEARSDADAGDRPPASCASRCMRLTGWARAFNADLAVGRLADRRHLVDRPPGSARARCRSPRVFNFFRPGYTPPNSAIATAGLVAPEFQITNEPSVIAYVNYMQRRDRGTAPAISGADYARPGSRSADTRTALVDEVDLLLGAGQLRRDDQGGDPRARSTRSRPGGRRGRLNRVYTAILLTPGRARISGAEMRSAR